MNEKPKAPGPGRGKKPRGEVRILLDRCKGCGFCVEFCPLDVLVMSEEFTRKGYHFPVVVRAEACVDCDLCDLICPDFAIVSVPLSDGEEAAEAAAPVGQGAVA